MKKIPLYSLLLFIVICVSVSTYAYRYITIISISNDTIIVQAEDTFLTTPNGTIVLAMIPSEGMTSARMLHDLNVINLHYSGVQIVGNATTTYNCHSYAWHMTEDNGFTCWFNDPSYYWEDFSYVETTAAFAEKIVYGTGAEHSAVKSTGGKYISKWGPGFLIKHNPTDTPYGSYMKYYAKPPQISGHPIVSNSVSSTFTLAFAPQNLSIQWVYNTNLFTAIGSTTGSSVTLKAKSTSAVGTGTLTAQFKKNGIVVATSTYAIYANRLPSFGNLSLRVVRSSDGVEVYPAYVGLCPNTYYYAYLTGTYNNYDYTWDMNHATVYNSSYNQAYFKTDSEGWTFLDIYATDSASGVSQNIHGVTLYGGDSCN